MLAIGSSAYIEYFFQNSGDLYWEVISQIFHVTLDAEKELSV